MTHAEYDPRYLAGIDAFNAGDDYAAHEIWEEIWRHGPTEDRLFYQSLIQAAVAIYHAGRENPAGARRLVASGRAKAAGYYPTHRGLDLVRFWHETESHVEALLACSPDRRRPTMTLDADLRPTPNRPGGRRP